MPLGVAYTLVSRAGAKRSAAMSFIHRWLLQRSMKPSTLHHSMDSRSAERRTLRATCEDWGGGGVGGVNAWEGRGAKDRGGCAHRIAV